MHLLTVKSIAATDKTSVNASQSGREPPKALRTAHNASEEIAMTAAQTARSRGGRRDFTMPDAGSAERLRDQNHSPGNIIAK